MLGQYAVANLGGYSGMLVLQSIARCVACLVGVAALVALAACAGGDQEPPSDPSFYRSLASAGAELDTKMAASMISGYRSNNGLSAVSLDPELTKLAQAQARAMAAVDKLDHNVGRGFTERLRSSGYDARVAAENVGAGYHTLAQAFSGWRDSPPHRKNMLLPGATHMGIAAVYSPRSKYKVFWALILAAPDNRRG
jgi:uncharacterized protein YkwD